jgi:DNA-binding transcriptional LysR family regulator
MESTPIDGYSKGGTVMADEAVELREKVLSELDLNLLVTFAVLFRETNVSKAAQCLSIGQPAVSNALGKLRRYFNDPLFTRGYRKMCPTPKAIQLARDIVPALGLVQKTVLSITDADNEHI